MWESKAMTAKEGKEERDKSTLPAKNSSSSSFLFFFSARTSVSRTDAPKYFFPVLPMGNRPQQYRSKSSSTSGEGPRGLPTAMHSTRIMSLSPGRRVVTSPNIFKTFKTYAFPFHFRVKFDSYSFCHLLASLAFISSSALAPPAVSRRKRSLYENRYLSRPFLEQNFSFSQFSEIFEPFCTPSAGETESTYLCRETEKRKSFDLQLGCGEGEGGGGGDPPIRIERRRTVFFLSLLLCMR